MGFGRALTSEEHAVFNNMEVATQEGELFIIDYDGTMNPDENAPSNRVNHASVVALRAMAVFDVNALIITGNGRGTVGDAVSHALGEAFSNYSDELLDRSLSMGKAPVMRMKPIAIRLVILGATALTVKPFCWTMPVPILRTLKKKLHD